MQSTDTTCTHTVTAISTYNATTYLQIELVYNGQSHYVKMAHARGFFINCSWSDL